MGWSFATTKTTGSEIECNRNWYQECCKGRHTSKGRTSRHGSYNSIATDSVNTSPYVSPSRERKRGRHGREKNCRSTRRAQIPTDAKDAHFNADLDTKKQIWISNMLKKATPARKISGPKENGIQIWKTKCCPHDYSIFFPELQMKSENIEENTSSKSARCYAWPLQLEGQI